MKQTALVSELGQTFIVFGRYILSLGRRLLLVGHGCGSVCSMIWTEESIVWGHTMVASGPAGELRSYIAGIHGIRSGRQAGRRIAGQSPSALRTDTRRAGGSWPCKFCWGAIHRRGCDWMCAQMKVNQPSRKSMEDPRAEPKVLAWEEDNIGAKNRYISNPGQVTQHTSILHGPASAGGRIRNLPQ